MLRHGRMIQRSLVSRLAARRCLALKSEAARAVALVAAIAILPASPVLAQTSAPTGFVRWSPGADAVPLDGTNIIGVIEEPLADSQYTPDVGVPVRGWVVDRYSATRPDRVLVYEGAPAQNGGRLLVEAQPYVWRMDVGNLLGSSAYKVSGFEGTVPPGSLTPGGHTLTVAAHLGALGWWTTSVRIAVGPPAPAPANVPDGTVRFACVPAASLDETSHIEVTVSSARPFPVRDQIVVLRVGPARSFLSRYPDDGDLHTLIFSVMPEELISASASDSIVVSYGLLDKSSYMSPDDVWQFGRLDPANTVLAACATQASSGG